MDPNDHRAIGRRLDLFHFQEEAPGMVFWHPRGLAMYRALENACRRYVERQGYAEVRSPQLVRQALWERSGHWQHFREHMFCLEDDDGVSAPSPGAAGHASALKPVSCPCHLAMFR